MRVEGFVSPFRATKVNHLLISTITTLHSILFLQGWKGSIGADAANHLPPVLRILGEIPKGTDWYADSAAKTLVHFFYAQLFRVTAIDDRIGFIFFAGIFISVVFLTHLALVKIFFVSQLTTIYVFTFYLLSYFLRIEHVYGYSFHVDPGVTPRSISWLFTLWALYFLVVKKFPAMVISLLFSSLIHPSDSLIATSVILFAYLFVDRSDKPRISYYFLLTPYLWPFFIIWENTNMIEGEENRFFAWVLIYFRATYLKLYNFEIILIVIAAGLTLVYYKRFAHRIQKLNAIIFLTSSAMVLCWQIGVRTLNYQLLQLYGIRALNLLFLTFFILLASLVNSTYISRVAEKRQRAILFSTFMLSSLILLSILSSRYGVSRVEFLTPQRIDWNQAFTNSQLKYPCTLSEKQCQQKITSRPTPFEIYSGNYVTIKQLGFGNAFFREWVIRLNKALGDCLVVEFQKQVSRKSFQDVNSTCSRIDGNPNSTRKK